MNNSKSRNGGKALIVSPYLDHLGGGERYILSCATALETLGYQIVFGWDNLDSINAIADKLALPLHSPNLAPFFKELYHSRNPLKMYFATKAYDLVIYLSDGSIPLLGAKRNLLHLQVPFHNIGGKNWKNQLKKLSLTHIIVNSHFTKNIVDPEYAINSKVLYPPVNPITARLAKQNLILSVGRFEPSLNIKKHNIMINAFKQLLPSLPSWRLVLVGGSSSDTWINTLQTQIGSAPIEILPNLPAQDLATLYAQSKIYWHAAGYQVDEKSNPELVEHFGISTVEAISARTIPLVYGAGGQKEIIKNPNLLWITIPELIQKTLTLTSQDFAAYESELDISAFTYQSFVKNLSSLI